MRDSPSSPKVPAKFGVWKRLAVLVLAFAALGLLGSALLFSGSEVECVEGAAERGLELRCDFDVAASPLAVFEALTATGEPRPFYFDAVLAMKVHLETGSLPIRARLYTIIFKPGMKLLTTRAEPWE